MMVQTRATSKRVESRLAQPQDISAVVTSPTKKSHQDGTDSGPSKRRRRKEPGELCQLNLDVLFLIAAYIHPLDLLNLARTCKSLRELLMGKSSAFVWKTARRQVKGLPDCPADLTEPEYADLVFYARCHGCGKYAKKVLWRIRRRYCASCRTRRLCKLSSCPESIRRKNVLSTEELEDGSKMAKWVDNERLDSLVHEYNRCSKKEGERFLREKRDQFSAIREHARQCERWEEEAAKQHKLDLEMRRLEREQNIFERIKRHGFEPEVAYYGHYAIQHFHLSLFNTSRPLTDKNWAQMWPKLLETMNKYRSQRINTTVYGPRRDLLSSRYFNYAMSPPPNTPAFDLLPYTTDLFRLPTFRNIIQAPEGTNITSQSFDPVFQQLPVLVDEWKKQLDAEFAELVKIPSHSSFKHHSGGQNVASSSATRIESFQEPADRLRLACAVFRTDCVVAWYPEILFPMSSHPICRKGKRGGTMSMRDRFKVEFVEDAPYIIKVCGLDPNVATVEDMDYRNARLRCLSCNSSYIQTWRAALLHAASCRDRRKTSSKSPRWQVIGDEYLDTIQAAELSVKKISPVEWTRCLVCLPKVGDGKLLYSVISHLHHRHGIKRDDVKQDVHYMPLGIRESCTSVEMVEGGGEVSFKIQDTQDVSP